MVIRPAAGSMSRVGCPGRIIGLALVLGVVVAMLAAAIRPAWRAGWPACGPSNTSDAMLDSGAPVTVQ
jgi:hypothetical protein